MTWEIKMIMNHWRQTKGGWQLAYRIDDKQLFLPFWMVKTWKKHGMIPTIKGGRKL